MNVHYERWAHLTNRQIMVIKGVASGKSDKEIAVDLGIEIKTVKCHLSNIYEELRASHKGIGNMRIFLTRLALDLGIVE